MLIRVLSHPIAIARTLARDVARHIAAHRDIVLGLPTGRTPVPLYAELVSLHRAGQIDFSRASTFNLDEFLGVDAGDPHSYRSFMNRQLFAHVNLRRDRIHFLNGGASDVRAECARYERAIERAGGIDLQILGLGANGHIGFNEPAASLVAHTHLATLSAATRRANAAMFDNRLQAVPRQALSMGMATILHARRIVLIATGSKKASCAQRMVEGPVTPKLPASFLQLHRNVEIWLDAEAASRLSTTPSGAPRHPRRWRP